jgi:hypothetical protein
MPQPAGAAPKAPVNLQGIWNLDRRPAWDCDDHLDLNVQMCYWGLDAMFLGELMEPLMDWVTRLIPQGLRDIGRLGGRAVDAREHPLDAGWNLSGDGSRKARRGEDFMPWQGHPHRTERRRSFLPNHQGGHL